MVKWLLVLAIVQACPAADGSVENPYFVLETASSAQTTGTSCDPFPSLSIALTLTSDFATVVLSLSSDCGLPATVVSNALSLQGNSKVLRMSGEVLVTGQMEVVSAELTAAFLTPVFQVTGKLALVACTLKAFQSTVILVGGQVFVSHSVISGSQKGVFSVLVDGIALTVTNTRFLDNEAISGTIFFVAPVDGSGDLVITIENCQFSGNSAANGGSVMLLQDVELRPDAVTHSISFTECQFSGHPTAAFQLTISNFLFALENSQFIDGAQIAVGTLINTNVSISNISATNCTGPLLSFQGSGALDVSASNFSGVTAGPLLVYLGVSVSTSMVRMKQLRLSEFHNLDTKVFSTVVNAKSVALWMEDVELRNYTVRAYGVHYLVNVALHSTRLAAYNGVAKQNIVGIILGSSFVLNSTFFENVNSDGPMWMISSSTGSMSDLVYHEIQGVYNPSFNMYTINFFMTTMASVTVDRLQSHLVHAGITLTYNFYSLVTLTNSRLTGKLGLKMMTIQGGMSVFRNTTLAFTDGRSLFMLFLDSNLDMDSLVLKDISLDNAITLSSGSAMHLGEVSMDNVTCNSLFKGREFRLRIDRAVVVRSTLSYLVHFSMGITVHINALDMRDSVGSLWSVFSSNVTVANALLSNVTLTGMLMYLSASRSELVSTTITQLRLQNTGSLVSLFDQSVLVFTDVTLTNITSTEHGVMLFKRSTFQATHFYVRSLNMSLITASNSWLSVSDSEVTDIVTTFDGRTLSMLPSGGFIFCTDCPLVVVARTRLRNIAANQGGSIYAALSDSRTLGAVELTDSTFDHCSGKTGGGVISTHYYSVQVRNCVFADNTARDGGVFEFIASSQVLRVQNSTFLNNESFLKGSCISWVGTRPELSGNNFSGNRALYGDPQASTAHHLELLELAVQGVTGQRSKSLVVGVFDALGQRILTDNSTVVVLQLPDGIAALGSLDVISQQGSASFSLLFHPFSTATFNLVFYVAKDPSIANLTVPYSFRDCKAGEIRTEDGCFPCHKNSYSFDPADFDCRPCPAHAVCYGGTDMSLDANYWRSGNLTDDLYRCLTPEACLGGLLPTCAAGYTGVLCGACAEGYYHFGLWTCRHCENEIRPEGRGVIVAVLLLTSVGVPPAVLLRKDGLPYRFAVVFRLFMNYAHAMMFTLWLQAQWSFGALVHHEVLRVLGSWGAVLVYPNCQYQDLDIGYYFFQVVAVSLYPFLIVAAAATIFLPVGLKLHYAVRKVLHVTASAVLIGVYNFLPVLFLMLLSMCHCKEVEQHQWLLADMSQECWSGAHGLYFKLLVVPLLVLVFACHILAASFLLRRPKTAIFSNVHDYLTSGFGLNYQKWELHIMLRKGLLVYLSLAYIALDKFSQIVLFSSVMGAAIFHDCKRLPYASLWLNVMNLLSHAAVFASVFAADVGTSSQILAVSCTGTFLVIASGLLALRYQLNHANSQYEIARVNPDLEVPQHLHDKHSSLDCSSLGAFAPPCSLYDEASDMKDSRLG